MIFFFNLSILEAETECNPKLMIEKLRLFYSKKHMPKNGYSKIKPIRNLTGNSYIINPASFFADDVAIAIFFDISIPGFSR